MDNLYKKILVLSSILLIFNQSVLAKEELILSPSKLIPAQVLPSPPDDDSVEALAERAYIKSAGQNATVAQMELAKKDADTKNVSYLSDTIPLFDLDTLPKTKELFKVVAVNERATTEVFKDYFNRKRPYQIDSTIHPCMPSKEKDLNASDPSGHTTMAFTVAVIMANLLPEYSPKIMERAELYGRNRVICGAHHPFDVRSGQVLGTLLGFELMKNEKLKDMLEESRVELDKKIPKKENSKGKK